LPVEHRLLGLVVSCRANRDGDGALVSAPQLVELTQLSERTARRRMADLLAMHWLERTNRGHGGDRRRRANIYRLTLPANPNATVAASVPASCPHTVAATGHHPSGQLGDPSGQTPDGDGHPSGLLKKSLPAPCPGARAEALAPFTVNDADDIGRPTPPWLLAVAADPSPAADQGER
jgi:hypothetical protein